MYYLYGSYDYVRICNNDVIFHDILPDILLYALHIIVLHVILIISYNLYTLYYIDRHTILALCSFGSSAEYQPEPEPELCLSQSSYGI